MKNLLLPTFCVSLLALSWAADAEPLYFFGGLGAAGYAQAQSDLGDAVAANAPASGSSGRSAPAFKLGAGYQIDPHWAVEAGLVATGKFNRAVNRGVLGTDTREMDYQAVFASGVFYIPVGWEKGFSLRAGLVGGSSSRRYTTNGANATSDKDNGLGATLGLGFSTSFTKNASIFIDYDMFSSEIIEPGQTKEQATFGLLTFGIKGHFQ